MTIKTDSLGRRIGHAVLFVLALPGILLGLAAVLLMLACLTPYFWVKELRRENRFRKMLRKQGRLATLTELSSRLEAGQGTLIEEWGPKGVCRVWWTADDLAVQAPQLETDDLLRALYSGEENLSYEPRRAFNAMCLDDYIGGNSGKASLALIPMHHTRIERYLGQFPSIRRLIVIPPPSWWRANRVA
jgi:hypothetical protein